MIRVVHPDFEILDFRRVDINDLWPGRVAIAARKGNTSSTVKLPTPDLRLVPLIDFELLVNSVTS